MAKQTPLLTDADAAAVLNWQAPKQPLEECFNPAHEGVECLCANVGEMANDMGRLAEVLKEMLEYSRVKTIGAFHRGRCLSCNVPHLFWRKCPCPHHKAVELLKELGMECKAT